VEQDDAADVLFEVRSAGEKQLAVSTAVLLDIFDVDLRQTLADRRCNGHNNAIQFKFKVKMPMVPQTLDITVTYGRETRNRRIVNFVLNDLRQCVDFTSAGDGRLFQVYLLRRQKTHGRRL